MSLVKCKACDFWANEEAFEKAKGRDNWVCPKCGEVDTGNDESNIDVMEPDGEEWSRTRAVEYLIDDHAECIADDIIHSENGGSISLDEMLANGFVGYAKMTLKQLEACMCEDDGITVIEDEAYKEKYGEMDT